MNLPVLPKYQNALRLEREKSCELKSVEITDLSQRQIHGDVRTVSTDNHFGAFVLANVTALFLYVYADGYFATETFLDNIVKRLKSQVAPIVLNS